MLKIFLAASLIGLAAAECPNACSGHGTCGVFDMCTCYRNWQAADCSQRTCPFDLAHVDTPKGDLNHDNAISSIATADIVLTSSTVYPKGTTEMFPSMQDTEGTAIYTSAHYYMECSNKGICDRTTGECDCYDGYDGTACQRASCPNDCSGHGTCETISELAFDNFENVYALWDKDATMGCACDAGYSAADCSQRHCKVGVDPLYEDDTTARYTSVKINIATTGAAKLGGTFQVKFYDVWGEDYVTVPITASGSTAGLGDNTCTPLIAALVALPNNVINSSVPPTCTNADTAGALGFTLTVGFPGNPGYLKSLEIVAAGLTDADSAAATASTVVTNVATIVTGENIDYFSSQCTGVSAVMKDDATWADKAGSHGHLYVATEAARKLLKACLGDSNGDSTDNVEVYNWDYGSMTEYITAGDGRTTQNVIGAYPHAIKVLNPTTLVSELHLLWWDTAPVAAGEEFRIASPNFDRTGSHNVHTTQGTVQQLGYDSKLINKEGSMTSLKNETRVVGYFSQYSNKIYTNIDASCEAGNSYLSGLHSCVQKGDKLFVVDGCWGSAGLDYFGGEDSTCADAAAAATGTGNLYTVNKIYTKPWTTNTDAVYSTHDDHNFNGADGFEDRFVIEVDQNIPWDGSTKGDPDALGNGSNSGFIVLFKFTPATDGGGSYTYVSECSNRGACDRESGLCQCFKGYTSDNCSLQSSLAV